MTAHAMKGDRDRCLEAGFDDHLPKPVRADLLRGAIENRKSRVPDDPRNAPEEPAAQGRFDREAALAMVGGNDELLSQVAGLFLDDCPRLLATIDEAIRQADPAALERSAHTLRAWQAISPSTPWWRQPGLSKPRALTASGTGPSRVSTSSDGPSTGSVRPWRLATVRGEAAGMRF